MLPLKAKGGNDLRDHKRKMIAPIIISVIMILYYVIYFVFLTAVLDGILKYIFGILPLAFVALTVKVCIERIKEIEGGEEDDISKY